MMNIVLPRMPHASSICNTCHDTHRRGSGVLVTLSSVGAGALGTVALLFLYPRMTTLKIVGTDLAHAIPLTAVAGIGHLGLGNVDVVLLGSLLIGSLPGIWVGSHLSAKDPERFFTSGFGLYFVADRY